MRFTVQIVAHCLFDVLLQAAVGARDGFGHLAAHGSEDFLGVTGDDKAFAEKMLRLTEQLGEQMAKGVELDALIRQKLGGLGYEF